VGSEREGENWGNENVEELMLKVGVVRDGGRGKVENGRWRMEGGEWKVENGRWRMEGGKWKVENGRWRMEDGGWRMEDGGWRMEDAWTLRIRRSIKSK
jgi:hypothetical protein